MRTKDIHIDPWDRIESPEISIYRERADSFEKTLMLGKIEGRRRRGRQRMRWLHGITDSTDMGLGGLRESCWWTGRPGVLWFMGSPRVRHDWATEEKWSDIVNSSMPKEVRLHKEEKRVSSVSSDGKSAHTCTRITLESFLMPSSKATSQWIKHFNAKPEAIKLLEENTSSTLSDISPRNIFWICPPRQEKQKQNKWDSIQLKSFPRVKETIHKMKDNLNVRKYLRTILPEKGFISIKY